ncbi:hypothetical protein NYE69_33220 [Paenibacillus sp. FSL R5-0527]|uniref:hypothetical protein n=1 Tax=Paenibacillus sp. FSL R5-0527 TaxID=2975321 RepID=UPI000979E0D1|nr:hypothetical protein BK140_32445 [Paenibacillus macerans]
MIPWVKYDPENPPEKNKVYLVTDGKLPHTAYLDTVKRLGLQWWQTDMNWLLPGITHYAEINLPGEETE